ERHRAFRNSHANGARHLRGLAAIDLDRGQFAARTIVPPRTAGTLRRFPFRVQLPGGAITVVRAARRDELLRDAAITGKTLGLKEGSRGTVDGGAVVPGETEPADRVENAFDHFVRRALDVGVFDPQDEHAAVPAREEPVEERSARTADVKIAGGRWRESNAR